MAESKSTAATTNHVKGKDINGQMVTLERTQPRQLSLSRLFCLTKSAIQIPSTCMTPYQSTSQIIQL